MFVKRLIGVDVLFGHYSNIVAHTFFEIQNYFTRITVYVNHVLPIYYYKLINIYKQHVENSN